MGRHSVTLCLSSTVKKTTTLWISYTLARRPVGVTLSFMFEFVIESWNAEHKMWWCVCLFLKKMLSVVVRTVYNIFNVVSFTKLLTSISSLTTASCSLHTSVHQQLLIHSQLFAIYPLVWVLIFLDPGKGVLSVLRENYGGRDNHTCNENRLANRELSNTQCILNGTTGMVSQRWVFLKNAFTLFHTFQKHQHVFLCPNVLWPSDINFFVAGEKKKKKKTWRVFKIFMSFRSQWCSGHLYYLILKSANLGVKGGLNVNLIWTPWEIPAQESTNTWRLHTHVYKPVSVYHITMSQCQCRYWRKMCISVAELILCPLY